MVHAHGWLSVVGLSFLDTSLWSLGLRLEKDRILQGPMFSLGTLPEKPASIAAEVEC